MTPPILSAAEVAAPVAGSTSLAAAPARVRLPQEKDAPFYVQAALRLEGAPDRLRLAAALREELARHARPGAADGQESLPLQPFWITLEGYDAEAAVREATARLDAAGAGGEHAAPAAAGVQCGEEACLLVVRMPALLADGASLLNVLTGVYAAYRGETGRPDPPVPYDQYLAWQAALQDEPDPDAVYFWEGYDGGEYQSFRLPFEQPRPPARTAEPVTYRTGLDAADAAALEGLARRLGAETDAVLLAVLQVLMFRHTDRERIPVGKVMTGRAYEELKETVGPLAGIIPFAIPLNGRMAFDDLVGQLALLTGKITDWEPYCPPAMTGDPASALPLGFAYYDLRGHSTPAGAEAVLVDLAEFTRPFTLKLSCLHVAGAVHLDFCFDPGALDSQAVGILAGQYRQIIRTVVAQPQVSVGGALPSPGWASFAGWEGAAAAGSGAPQPVNVVSLFEAQARQHPNQPAVVSGGEMLTYARLDEAAGKLAYQLRHQHGVKPGDVVGLLAERSDRMIIALLGILKAGGAYLPLDPGGPGERRKYALADAGVRLLLTDSAFLYDVMDGYGGELFVLDMQLADLPSPPAAAAAELAPGDPAYVIYTSGSTGKPKGVRIGHGALGNYVQWFNATFRVGTADSTLLFSSIAFDLCYTGLWTALTAGATLHLLRESKQIDPGALTGVLAGSGITYLKLTPSHFNILVNTDLENLAPRYRLRLVVIGGEEIRVPDLETYCRHRPDVTFVNHYGPTETTIGCVYKVIGAGGLEAFGRRPVIGRPIRNARAWVLTPAGEPVPVGIAGELGISGAGVGIGYIGQEELTRRKFIPHPGEPGERLYLTGDLVRRTAGGEIEFLGRMDDQVKVRGYRIEPGEIEEALRQYPRVSEAAVLVRTDATGDRQLVGYAESKEPLESSALRTYLAQRLPDYMIPAHLLVVKQFPLTANGKIDRKQLPPVEAFAGDGAGYVAPRNETEAKLAAIWAEVLGRARVGIHDNFFHLGGHSLKAVQVIARVHKELQARVELKHLFDAPTVAGLAVTMQGAGKSDYQSIRPLGEQPHYELSYAQQQLWIAAQLQEDQIAYNRTLSYHLEAINRPALEKAFEWLVRRHEILRTTFITVGREPRQRVNPYEAATYGVQFTDLRGQAGSERLADAALQAQAQTVFDLEKGPLLKACLLRTGEAEYLFSLTLHHILCDGWSIEILKQEMHLLYDACNRGEASPLAPLKVQYKDYAHWSNALGLEKEEAFWLKKLSGKREMTNLPFDAPRRENRRFNGAGLFVAVDGPTTDALRGIARDNGTTLSNTVLAVFFLFLHKITGQQDLLAGIGHANRNDPDLENLIGLFVNTVVVPAQFRDDMRFEELLQQVAQSSLEAYDNRNYPFDRLVEKLQVARNGNYLPLINVVYIYRNYKDLVYSLGSPNGSSPGEPEPGAPAGGYDHGTSKTDLLLYVNELENRLLLGLEYDSDLFTAATMQALAGLLQQLFPLITAARP